MKAIVLIMDGLGDLPNAKGQTPLSAASKPNMDELAGQGQAGLYSSIARGVIPGSDTSHLNIFGYDYREYYPGRGPLEALGAGIELKPGDIAFRANFASVKGGKIIDRRAGRLPTATSRKLARYVEKSRIDGVTVQFMNTVEHRGVLLFRGKGLGAEVSGTDPHVLGPLGVSKPLAPGAKNKKTADVLNKFTKSAMKKLEGAGETRGSRVPANAIIARGAGAYAVVPSMEDRYRISAACVGGGALYKGVAKYVGMDVLEVEGATGDKKTNLKAKADAAAAALKDHDYVFVHVKATDNFSHDGNFGGKKEIIEKVDELLVSKLMEEEAVFVITGDHSTPVERRSHSGHPTPLLISGRGVRKDTVSRFDEMACMSGGLCHVVGTGLMDIVLNEMNKAKMIGT